MTDTVQLLGFEKRLEEFRQRFERGEFKLKKNGNLREIVKNEKVPKSRGVYVIWSVTNGTETVVYVGKSGTVAADGTWGAQTLRSRIVSGKQQGASRRVFFPTVIEKSEGHLRFEWFVTSGQFDGELLPAFAEALLVQEYYGEYKRIPCLNKKY